MATYPRFLTRSVFLIFLGTPLFGQYHSTGSVEKPNIILIMADDLGYGDLGCYGQQIIQTPHIDRLASGGLRFTECYAGSTVCAPSRSVLMTGKHTGHTTVRGNNGVGGVIGIEGLPGRIPLLDTDTTIAEVLQAAGYATGIVGKWGLGEPNTDGEPNRQGFDEFFGFLNQRRAHSYYPDFIWKNTHPFFLPGNENGQQKSYVHDLFTQEALSFIERHQQHPFFLYLPYTAPHEHLEVPDLGIYADSTHWQPEERIYAAMVTRLDRDIGTLMQLLDKLNLTRKTLVIFCSDNGPAFSWENRFHSAGPLRGIKRDMYEGGIRVPMILHYPGVVPAGKSSTYPWYFADMLPTLAALAHTPAPSQIDGKNILPAFLGDAPKRHAPHRPLYWEFHERGFQQAIRWKQWKAIRLSSAQPWQLFNLEKDPGEQHDLSVKKPKHTRRLAQRAAESHTPSPFFPVAGEQNKGNYRFDFGSGKLQQGFLRILPSDLYTPAKGYGFLNSAPVQAVTRISNDPLRSDLCRADHPFYFSVDVPEGNYDVRITVGDADAPTATLIKSESRRLMTDLIQTRKGAFRTIDITVNVRRKGLPSGQEVKLTSRETEHLNWDEQLTLEFNGSSPAVCALEIKPAKQPITVYLAGNSTVTDQKSEPWASWGQMLPRFFNPGKIVIANHAESGESLKRFQSENRLDKIMSTIRPGDYLFIEFGHNDQKPQSSAYVAPFTGFRDMLLLYISEARKKGAIPVIVTPVQRRTFDTLGKMTNSHGDYPEAARQTAREAGVAYLDLHSLSTQLFEALGAEESKKAYVHYPLGSFPGQDTPIADDTHFSNYGAYLLAQCIVYALQEQQHPLAAYLQKNLPAFEPGKPMPAQQFLMPASPDIWLVKPEGN